MVCTSRDGKAADEKKSDVSTCKTIGASFILLVLRATTKPPLADHTLKKFQVSMKYVNSIFLHVNPSTWVIPACTFRIFHLSLHSLPILSSQTCSSQQAFATRRNCRSGGALRERKTRPHGRVYAPTSAQTHFISHPRSLIFISNTDAAQQNKTLANYYVTRWR